MEESRLRIKEALEKFNEGAEKKKTMIDLAREIWKDSEIGTQRMNISKFANGKRRRIDIDYIPILCRELKCDANFLFGIKPMKP